MIKRLFKRIWNDKRGNALVIAGAALPLVFGSAGLATDTVQWTLWKRQLQRAADSAAYAGVYARFQDQSSSAAVTADLATNNKLWAPLLTGYPVVTEPADTAVYTKAVEVSLRVQQSLTFSSMFMSAAPVITVTARAAAIDDGEYCLGAEEDTITEGIKINGGANVTLGCKAFSHSLSSTASVQASSSSYTFSTTGIGAVGGMPSSITGTSSDTLKQYQLPFPDPFKDKHSTVVPSSALPCGDQSDHTVLTQGNVTTLSPGCYSGNNAFKFNGETILQSGTYYLDNVDFDVSATGAKVSGTGVTIILTGSDPGSIKLTGGQINLTAPTTGDYAKMLFIQSSSADLNNGNTFSGNSNSSFDGAFYMPRGDLNMSGGAGATTKCALIWSRRIVFSGNADLQNNTTGCVANSTVKGKAIRLIA